MVKPHFQHLFLCLEVLLHTARISGLFPPYLACYLNCIIIIFLKHLQHFCSVVICFWFVGADGPVLAVIIVFASLSRHNITNEGHT